MKKFPPVARDKESGLPKKYVAGLSTSTAKARAAHWKKTSKMSDSDPRAYKPAPGDATAKTKLSKYTKKYHQMFGERTELEETIVKVDGKYRLVSKKTGRNLGTYDTKAGAMKRERQVQYFKHMGEEKMADYKPKVGDHISTIKGGQNTGKVEKVEGGHVYFRSDYKRSTLGRGDDYYPIFKTHVSNVRLHEGAKDWQKAFKSVARKNLEKDTAYPRASVYKLDQTQKLRSTEHDDYDQIAHDVKTGKRMKEEVEQIDEIKISDVINATRGKSPEEKQKIIQQMRDKENASKPKTAPRKLEPPKDIPMHQRVYPDDMKYHGDSYEPTGNVIKEGFLSFLSKKKPTLKKPTASHKQMRAVFSNLERQTRVAKPQQHGPVIHRSTVAAYESVGQIDERNKENKEKLKNKLRTIGVNAAITNPKKIEFGRSALTMGREALKKLSSAEVSKASRYLPRVAEQSNAAEITKKTERERRIRDTRVLHHQNRHIHQAAMGTMEESAGKSLADKARKSGVSLATLRKVYNRGVAAWNSGHRPGTTPQQWGHARVNSYITKGKTYHTADKDLRRESVDVNEAFEREFGDK